MILFICGACCGGVLVHLLHASGAYQLFDLLLRKEKRRRDSFKEK